LIVVRLSNFSQDGVSGWKAGSFAPSVRSTRRTAKFNSKPRRQTYRTRTTAKK